MVKRKFACFSRYLCVSVFNYNAVFTVKSSILPNELVFIIYFTILMDETFSSRMFQQICYW